MTLNFELPRVHSDSLDMGGMKWEFLEIHIRCEMDSGHNNLRKGQPVCL